jgi:transposase
LLIVTTEEWMMRKTTKSPGEKIVKDIKRATRKHYSSEEKIRIVLDGLRGEDSITGGLPTFAAIGITLSTARLKTD